jgi:hypothetical protein
MIDEALDLETHDLKYESYDCATVSGVDQVRQNVKMRLLFIRGEYFSDIRKGIPYFTEEFVKGDLSVIDSYIKAEILETPEVRNILSYSSSFDTTTRKFTIDVQFDTTYGTVSENLTLGG